MKELIYRLDRCWKHATWVEQDVGRFTHGKYISTTASFGSVVELSLDGQPAKLYVTDGRIALRVKEPITDCAVCKARKE